MSDLLVSDLPVSDLPVSAPGNPPEKICCPCCIHGVVRSDQDDNVWTCLSCSCEWNEARRQQPIVAFEVRIPLYSYEIGKLPVSHGKLTIQMTRLQGEQKARRILDTLGNDVLPPLIFT